MTRLRFLSLWHCEGLPPELRCVHKTPEEIAKLQAALAALA